MKAKHLLTGCVTGAVILLTSCGDSMFNFNKNATEFDWYATESAPEHYPMQIHQGTFYYKGQNQGLYIPSGGTLRAGWGQMNSSHVTGPEKKPLPDRVEVDFFSYAENQLYHGDFKLPYDQILALFREAHKEDPDEPYYDAIMIGVAPGGAVSVWLEGYRKKEIFFGQADKVDIDPSEGFNLPFDSKAESDEYVQGILTDVLNQEELDSLKKHGVPFGTWARYRKLYRWAPAYKDGKISTDKEMYVHYLNGELNSIPTLFTDDMANTLRPLPRALKFSVDMGDESIYYIIQFEEFELMDAFEKLGAQDQKVYLEFDARVPRQLMKIRVYNDKESIELKKTYIEE